jgi:hypothetical protein
MSATADGQSAVNAEPGTVAADRIAALRARLMTPLPDRGIWGWVWPLLVTVFGLLAAGSEDHPHRWDFSARP